MQCRPPCLLWMSWPALLPFHKLRWEELAGLLCSHQVSHTATLLDVYCCPQKAKYTHIKPSPTTLRSCSDPIALWMRCSILLLCTYLSLQLFAFSLRRRVNVLCLHQTTVCYTTPGNSMLHSACSPICICACWCWSCCARVCHLICKD